MNAQHEDALIEALRPLLRRVRTADSAIKKQAGGKTIMAWTDEPIDPTPEGRKRLLQHLNSGPYRGTNPMQYSSTGTMVGLYDLDSHKGEVPWPEMLAVARRLMEAMRLHGLEPVAFRSSGGKGIHIYCLWEGPQDAYSVRELMKAILLQLGYKSGTGGVKKREIEIFPKRDSMGEKRTVIRKGKPHVTRGGQFILPLAAESAPLDPVTLAVLPRTPESIKWPMSKPVNVLAKPERRPRHEGDPSVELGRLRSALAAIPDEAPEMVEYDPWVKMLAAIHYETEGSAEGLDLAHEFSARASNYDPDVLDDKWDSFDDDCDNPVTGGTIIHAARAYGWDFNDGPAGEWPEPHPLPAALPPVPPFDLAMLPPALRPWIEDIAERMQVGPDIPAIGAVVALSGAIGRRVQMMPKAFDEWTVVPNLWGMVVAPPGYMKSPALAEVMKPLQKLESEAFGEYEAARVAWEQEKAINKLRNQVNEQTAKANLKKGVAGLPEMLPEPEAPVATRYIVNNFSTEALGEVLIGNPNGVLAFSDELSGLLAMSQKPGNEGLHDFLLSAWNGDGAFTFDRIGRGLNRRIDHVCVAVLGGIQPGRLIDHITGATHGGSGDSGLAQRFQLLTWPDLPTEWTLVDRKPDSAAQEAAYRVFERVVGRDPTRVFGGDSEADSGADSATDVRRFDAQAQAAFYAWGEALEREVRGDTLPPVMASHLSKYRSLVPSLALIFAVADGVRGPVPLRYVEQAIAWARYLRPHAERAYACTTMPAVRHARALLAKIAEGKVVDGFKAADVYLKGWSLLSNSDDVKKATDLLCDLGYLRRVETRPQVGAGRTSISFKINPKVKGANI